MDYVISKCYLIFLVHNSTHLQNIELVHKKKLMMVQKVTKLVSKNYMNLYTAWNRKPCRCIVSDKQAASCNFFYPNLYIDFIDKNYEIEN